MSELFFWGGGVGGREEFAGSVGAIGHGPLSTGNFPPHSAPPPTHVLHSIPESAEAERWLKAES
jgi:hypothetical protein